MSKNEEEKEMPSFSSSSFDAATTTTAKDVAPADDGFKKEATDGIPGANGLFNAPQTEEMEYVALLLFIEITQQISITSIDK